MQSFSRGATFRASLKQERPLQIPGVINAATALIAKQEGFRALYLSGAGVANAAFGLPDLGLTSLTQVAEEAHRITQVVNLPLLVDADTGWGGELHVKHTVKTFIEAGVAGLHIEDQTWPKRCGHREGKTIISKEEMVAKVTAAVEGREHAPDFVIMARTDAANVEGLEKAIQRAHLYLEAGADMIFAESLPSLADYETFAKEVHAPVLANMTEFGKSPILHLQELEKAGIQMILYPLSGFRVMNFAVQKLFHTLRNEGTQSGLLESMQTRQDLYRLLDYEMFEAKIKRS